MIINDTTFAIIFAIGLFSGMGLWLLAIFESVELEHKSKESTKLSTKNEKNVRKGEENDK